MTRRELEDIVALGEGFTTEFKRAGTSNLGRELCALANATGGVLLIGVDDSGKVVGVPSHNKLKADVQSTARSVEPPLVVDVESVDDVLVVTVPPQSGKPYSFAGKFYLREGATSQQMGRDEIREFFFAEGVIHYDEAICKRYDVASAPSPDIWKRFAERVGIPDAMDMHTALSNLHLVRDGKMTNAGAWLLTEDIQSQSISANVSCALFMGREKSKILDRRDITGNVYDMIDQTVAYILSKINVELIIKHVRREEKPEIPEEAIREAVANALVHRDYRSTANTQVYIFKDRVEIVSPGGLPAGMTEAELGTKSIPRNPLLFSTLFRMDAVEHIGSGIRRIRELCEVAKISPPEIIVASDWVTIRFARVVVPEDTAAVTAQDEAHDEAHDKAHEPMTGVEGRILAACKDEPRSTPELLQALGYSNRTGNFKRAMAHLLEVGFLQPTLPEKPRSKKQRYRLTGEGRRIAEGGGPGE